MEQQIQAVGRPACGACHGDLASNSIELDTEDRRDWPRVG
jgi:hypothetical protein